MRKLTGSALLAFTTLAPGSVRAQAAPAAPQYNVLSVFRETVKPGKAAGHEALESAWAAANVAAKATPMLAVSAMSGAPENWYMSAFPTWADYAKSNKANAENPALAAIEKQYSSQEGEYLSDGRLMLLTFREDLSYGPPADLATTRYFSITRISTRPGHTTEYEDNRKMVKAAHESAHLIDSYSMWQAQAGAPAGTFFLIVARKSLAELDDAGTVHGPAYQAALGGAEGQAKIAAMQASAVISSELNHFAFAPAQSIPLAEWVAADPGFWKPKKKAP